MEEDKEDKISYEEMVALGKMQWEVAMAGDVRMLIWLGKNYLGQTESPMVITGEEELPEGKLELRTIESVCKECGNVTCVEDEDDVIEFETNPQSLDRLKA